MGITGTLRAAAGTWQTGGLEAVAGKALQKANRRWLAGGEDFPLALDEIADSTQLVPPPQPPARLPGETLRIGWLLTPPAPGSGGHTTIFRFVQALEAAGHECVLYLCHTGSTRAADYVPLMRAWWPGVKAQVRDAGDGLEPMDAFVATAWTTAHVLARSSRVPGRRFYLVQDFEPYFYARGALYELAEDTYRFGFAPIAVGNMVANELSTRFGINGAVADFGCDHDTYRVLQTEGRNGVVFYAKPGTARRGYQLGVGALAELHRLRPEVPIHTFGQPARNLPFPATVHSHLEPQEVNRLYNSCAAGLALSFTNISLIAAELLAAGVVPVVNDWPGSRADLDNPHVIWARATPQALGRALADALDTGRRRGAGVVGASVESMTWDRGKAALVQAIEGACTGAGQRRNQENR